MYQAIIIDDETLFLRHLETNVPWARYRTHIQRAFSSSQLALDYLKANPAIDILFTDIKMPGVNGIELIRALPIAVKQRAFIIALSGYEEYALVREAFLAGASDYLLKVDINTPAFESTMQQMLGFLDSRAKTAAGMDAPPEENTVENIKRYIQENLSQPLALSDLAAHFGFSPGYLSQLFSHASEGTLSDYIGQARIQKAQQLLLQTDMPITKIAFDVGFNSPEHFSRTFKKYTGASPRQYRQQDDE
ncbi:MAG TPA: helix-turn-helix domain-containing protein [Candidatus Alectryocaccomicrobium excrementavium]|uniref:Stage 0 sporulation protein A homolog n=1 Tax=Candidatus Alectryocaccomicrobium excrementavium TaxID=2840668 RepID=A0A9D1K6L5_9FIRM|nr:helix-turn-helix domain-containing protein [Candidatus Alectryocaccomicrobium excrementavium]